MPTFTTIALETLLEPRVNNALNSHQRSSETYAVVRDDGRKEEKAEKARGPNHIFISPGLYVTPVPAPIPEASSEPVSPSPYLVNHKRRRGGGVEAASARCSGNGDGVGEEVVEEEADELLGGGVGERDGGFLGEDGGEFLDPQCDGASVASSAEVDDVGRQAECRCCVGNQSEFFDANDDFSSDGSISNCEPRIGSELHALRLSLLEEIERRKAAEYAVGQMSSQWERLVNVLSQAGLTFPTPPNNATGMQLELNALEQICQELLVAKFVAEAIGRGEAHAEAEMAAETIIESKVQEISRLRDRLQYYETVNREMSQRNQEVMEVARRQRQRKKSQRRWLWTCLGLSVAIGASVIAYSYLPPMSEHRQLMSSRDSSDCSHVASAESA
ncbi:uncharacterized protein LOC127802751 [Diospyros lotus]|uniref:uncharacterized protein LOC127802751 n=1 Tax=Diospyros lotus TaxID=55363 RepID=UPI002258659E|nr:uncharacterized protein LOC127802751 [Diospyros lotus]